MVLTLDIHNLQMNNNKERAFLVAEILRHRRSVRRFTGQAISSDVISQLVEAGITAPSGSNWQNQRFMVLDRAEEIEEFGRHRFVWPYPSDQSKMKEAHPSGIIGGAALVIVVFAESTENDRRGNGEYFIWENLELQNCAASIQNILLMATAKGLGACWVSASDRMNYTRLLGKRAWRRAIPARFMIPKTWKLQGIIAIGEPLQKDDLGYAKGEKKHGATQWMDTARNPIEYYLAPERSVDSSPDVQALGLISGIFVTLGSSLIRLLLFLVKLVDKFIHRIEMPKVDLQYHEARRKK